MTIESQHMLEAFKIAPAIIALLVVIWLMYRLLKSKDLVLQSLVEVSKGDSERYGKLITLLEILVHQKKGG
jgi:succinate dehydrogenase hydrophobic anchor subunit